MKKKFGFTLVEILVSVAIVGIIAVLVLPAVITKYQQRGFDVGYKRELQTLSDLIDGLAVTEHTSNFHNTIMYLANEPEDSKYDASSGTFLKKYMRVSKYCGDSSSGCFADKYIQYKNRTKEEYTFEVKGSCALLKNGMSICISPQIGNTAISGWIDLNGPKGPNIYGRDLREFSLAAENVTAYNKSTSKVVVYCDEHSDPYVCPRACTLKTQSADCCELNYSTLLEEELESCCEFGPFKLRHSECVVDDTPAEPEPERVAKLASFSISISSSLNADRSASGNNVYDVTFNWRCNNEPNSDICSYISGTPTYVFVSSVAQASFSPMSISELSNSNPTIQIMEDMGEDTLEHRGSYKLTDCNFRLTMGGGISATGSIHTGRTDTCAGAVYKMSNGAYQIGGNQ